MKKLPITSITPFTFQDYPEHTACILWFSGCNMRCGYCHNPEMVRGELKKLSWEKVAEFLESRAGLLEGAVLSGGECTLCPALPELAEYLKVLGYKVKVDTNGTNPDILEQLLENRLVDFVALDFKAPEAKFAAISGYRDYGRFERSLRMLCAAQSGIGLEVRTTVHADQLDAGDILSMADTLHRYGYDGTYYLQQFRPGTTLAAMSAPTRRLDMNALANAPVRLGQRNFH